MLIGFCLHSYAHLRNLTARKLHAPMAAVTTPGKASGVPVGMPLALPSHRPSRATLQPGRWCMGSGQTGVRDPDSLFSATGNPFQ